MLRAVIRVAQQGSRDGMNLVPVYIPVRIRPELVFVLLALTGAAALVGCGRRLALLVCPPRQAGLPTLI